MKNQIENIIESLKQAQQKVKILKNSLQKPSVIKCSSQTLHPFIVNSLQKERKLCVIHDDFSLSSENITLLKSIFISDENSALIGKKVYLKFDYSGFLVATLKSEDDAYEEKLISIRAIEHEITTLTRLKEQAEVQQWHEDLQMPFDYRVDVKVVLSGLSESSMGNGCKRNSQFHMITLEDYKDGRYERKAGQFLCTQPKGRIAMDYQELDKEDNSKDYIITCPECLKRIERIQSKQ